MRAPIQVLVYPVRRDTSGDWEYLLLKRTPRGGCFWQGITGGVENDEDLTEAARRELIEETGLVPLLVERIDYSYSFPVDDRWRHLYAADVEEIKEYVFMAYVTGQQELEISSEHDQYKWCRFNEALGLLYWSENKEALNRCHKVVLAQS